MEAASTARGSVGSHGPSWDEDEGWIRDEGCPPRSSASSCPSAEHPPKLNCSHRGTPQLRAKPQCMIQMWQQLHGLPLAEWGPHW